MTPRSHNATSTASSPFPPGTAWATAHPKIQWDKRGKWEKRQRLLQGAPQHRGNFSSSVAMENATFHPETPQGSALTSTDPQPHHCGNWEHTMLHLKLHRPGSQLELFLGTERPDNFRAISVPRWGQRCWGRLCRCAQQRQLLGRWHHRGVLPGCHPPHTARDSPCRVPGGCHPPEM